MFLRPNFYLKSTFEAVFVLLTLASCHPEADDGVLRLASLWRLCVVVLVGELCGFWWLGSVVCGAGFCGFGGVGYSVGISFAFDGDVS